MSPRHVERCAATTWWRNCGVRSLGACDNVPELLSVRSRSRSSSPTDAKVWRRASVSSSGSTCDNRRVKDFEGMDVCTEVA